MKLEMRPTDSIKPYPKNPRKNDQAVDAVAKSIQEFGFRQPIVIDKNGTIVVGHTRWKAARKLGIEKVPVHVADLSPEKARAYRLADNKTHELAEWDVEKMLSELEEIGLEVPGFDGTSILTDEDYVAVEIKPLPITTWILLGIETVRLSEIDQELKSLRSKNLIMEMTANNEKRQ